jgi:hypothetical protein
VVAGVARVPLEDMAVLQLVDLKVYQRVFHRRRRGRRRVRREPPGMLFSPKRTSTPIRRLITAITLYYAYLANSVYRPGSFELVRDSGDPRRFLSLRVRKRSPSLRV